METKLQQEPGAKLCRELKVYEAAQLRVDARCKWNNSGVRLERGGLYRYAVEAGTWRDWTKSPTADGYPSPNWWFRALEPYRRAPKEAWFALMGAYARRASTQFLIGLAAELPAVESGELTCFANDLPFMYWNNHGHLLLSVTRVR